MAETIRDSLRIAARHAGERLDRVLAELLPDHSRGRLQAWIREGAITVDQQRVKPGAKLHGGELIEIDVVVEAVSEVRPQALAIDVLHADDDLIVLNKSAGLVVHPAAGNRDGTLQNALLHHYPELETIPRAGIVHRLDKLTSGVMVVARSLRAHTALVRQLQDRSMRREYRALVYGDLISGGTIDAPIARHPHDRLRMAVVAGGKPAVTHYRILDRFAHFSWLEVRLETGRTHQIRVHMAHIGHPLVADPVYGRQRLPAGAGAPLRAALQGFGRQALHALRLELVHPASGEPVRYCAPLAYDLRQLVKVLEEDDAELDRG